MFLFVVTQYGCNSTPSDMWTPITKIFTDYQEAYTHFLDVCPDTSEEGDSIYVNKSYDTKSPSNDYIIIENRCQSSCWKRPAGVVIARYGI